MQFPCEFSSDSFSASCPYMSALWHNKVSLPSRHTHLAAVLHIPQHTSAFPGLQPEQEKVSLKPQPPSSSSFLYVFLPSMKHRELYLYSLTSLLSTSLHPPTPQVWSGLLSAAHTDPWWRKAVKLPKAFVCSSLSELAVTYRCPRLPGQQTSSGRVSADRRQCVSFVLHDGILKETSLSV